MAGAFESRALLRDGLGCLLVRGDNSVPPGIEPESASPPPAEDIAGPEVVEPSDPWLHEVLDRAFAETDPGRPRWTKAVVVLHEGRVIAERYAPGYGPETPIWGHSLSKSLTSALIGILLREGKLKVEEPAPVPAWQVPDDPRAAVTIDQLLRMESGLPFDETSRKPNPAVRMWFLERDMAGYAEKMKLAAPPGTRWGYSNLGYLLLSRMVRDDAGGERSGRGALCPPRTV